MNNALKDKQEKLEKIRIRARTILAAHEKTGLPPEEEQTVNVLLAEAKTIQGEIETETKFAEKKRDLADLDRFLDDPVRTIPHGINPDEESKNALLKAGWEVKSGFVLAPTSLEGQSVTLADGRTAVVGKQLMYPADVLFGEIPEDDQIAAAYYRKTRAIFAPEYKAAFVKHMRLAVKVGSEKMAFTMLDGHEQKALSEGTDTAGGFIVPPDIQAEMLVRLPQKAIMRANCRVQPTNRDTLKWPAVKGNTGTSYGLDASHIYSSGFVGGWVGETPAFSDTDASFQTLDVPIKKLRVATRVSNDFLMDAAVNIMAWLAQNGAENMALTEDAGFIQGDGTALQPLGLINVGISTVSVEGTTADTITNTTASLGSATKLINLAYQLPAQYVQNAKWIMRRSIEGKIRQLVDGSGRFLWPPFTGSGFAETPGSLLGFPVLQSDWMADDGQDTVPVLYLGDLSAYIIGQRTQITSVVLRERFADTDQTGIILFERIGGSMYNTDSARLGIC